MIGTKVNNYHFAEGINIWCKNALRRMPCLDIFCNRALG